MEMKVKLKNKEYVLEEEKILLVLEKLSGEKVKRCNIKKYLKKYLLLDEEFLKVLGRVNCAD